MFFERLGLGRLPCPEFIIIADGLRLAFRDLLRKSSKQKRAGKAASR
jgi:hypothetical protein